MKKSKTNQSEWSVITETGEVLDAAAPKNTRKKAFIGAAAILGACTLMFGGATQIVLAAETSKTEQIPTTYPTSSAQQNLKDLEGYVKGDYEVFPNPEISTKPTANDISMEKAADIGAQQIWKLFGTNLDGKKVEMTYVASRNNERAVWTGWVARDQNKNTTQIETSYFFEIDALSGQVNTVQIGRVLPNSSQDAGPLALDEGFDPKLEQNCQVYQDLARTVTEQNHLLNGNIKSVEYYAQGATNNDPTIDLAVKSDAGEEIRLAFSRHDKALLAYCSNSWVQIANRMEAQVLNTPSGPSETVNYEVVEDENGNVVAQLVPSTVSQR